MIKVIEAFFKNKNVAVIVNEFGEISIDGKILSAKVADSNIIEINEGCVCCVLYDELNRVLSDLQEKHQFEYLFIETSGLSEPFPIYSALTSLGFDVESVVCLIDAVNYKNYTDDDVFRYQIGSSNVIVLNKMDMIDSSKTEDLIKDVQSLKEKYNLKNFLTGEHLIPNYEIITTSYGVLPEYIFKEIKLQNIDHQNISQIEDTHSHQNYLQEVRKYPNDSLTYQQFVKLIKSFPKNLIRAKGVLKLKDVDSPLLFNYSYGNYTFEEFPEHIEDGVIVSIYKSDIKLIS